MLKPLRSIIPVGRFPLDAPLGKRAGGEGGAFAFCPKNGCLVPQNNTNCPANMLALIVCPFKNVGNTYACMLFTAYQKARLDNYSIESQQIGKLAHKCGMLFLFQPTLPHNLCTLPFSRTLTTTYPT